MTAILIFISTFSLVFALGFQSLNVNNGHYKAAFMTSFAIGVSNLALFKTVPDANWLEIVAFLSGGPFGIVCSMWAHERWMPKRDRRGKVPPPEGKAWPEPPVFCPEANPIPAPQTAKEINEKAPLRRLCSTDCPKVGHGPLTWCDGSRSKDRS